MIRKSLPIVTGAGHVRLAGHGSVVDYSITGDPTKLKLGPARLRGSFRTSPDFALEAFRAGEALLTLADGSEFRVAMLGYTTGTPDVFVELRV